MWQQYLRLSTDHAFAAAFVQFLLLGTAGEILSTMIRRGQRRYPFSLAKTALKALGWGALGLYIKVMFLTAVAGVDALVSSGYLPRVSPLLDALYVSVLLNVMLGPSMMLTHRLTDNAIDRLLGDSPLGWQGLQQSLLTLLWLWIPLHTFTFTQPRPLRIGIAAGLSLLLGLVLGWFARPRADTEEP